MTDDQDAQLSEYCSQVFATLRRADQRRIAEEYVRGLLRAEGRKTVRGIAAAVGARSDQAFQQFVNQSPWSPGPVRRAVLDQLIKDRQPMAWLIEEVAFVKDGSHSVAIARQYSRTLQRIANCQLAVTASMVTGDFCVPVNWRLAIPPSWQHDTPRRQRARIPCEAIGSDLQEAHIAVLDELLADGGIPPAPIVIDARHMKDAYQLLAALDARRLPYAVQISSNMKVRHEASEPAYGLLPSGARARRLVWHKPLAELADIVIPERTTVSWRVDDRIHRSQFAALDVDLVPDAAGAAVPSRLGQEPDRVAILDWPFGRGPREYWITNMVDRDLDSLVAPLKHWALSGRHIDEMTENFGLRDYEGRMYPGWHHHVTLVSAAYAFAVLGR
jgi:SRSO17 transposase